MTLYIPSSGIAKKASKLYASVNGVTKEISKVYGSYNGVSRLVYQNTIDYIEIKSYQASGTYNVTIANQWSTPILVSVNNGTPVTIAAEGTATVRMTVNGTDGGDVLRIRESVPNSTFRNFQSTYTNGGLIKGLKCHVTKMPPMERFTTDGAGTTAGDQFFYRFNQEATIYGFPDGSFDTSKITTVGDFFFADFNRNGACTSLPDNSFNTSNIVNVGSNFFSNFNLNNSSTVSGLTALPVGSFDLSNITIDTSAKASAATNFFFDFNMGGKITKLPANSFQMPKIEYAPSGFFQSFNHNGALTGLPTGSFNFSYMRSGSYSNFLGNFNYNGKMTQVNSGGVSITNRSREAVRFYYLSGTSNLSTSVSAGGTFRYKSA